MRGGHRRGRFTVVGMLLACHSLLALNPALDISQYAHQAWTVGDLHLKGFIHSITQTPDGYLWLGTEFGLYRFDGIRAVSWSPPAGGQLPDHAIHSLLAARDGSLWIGTSKGLARWKGSTLTQYLELAGWGVNKILEDRDGIVWATGSGVTAGRLCAIQNSGVRCYGEDGRLGSFVSSLYEYHGGLWVGAAAGLWRWKPDPPQLYPAPGPVRELNDLIEGDNGALWMATRDGIRQLAGGKIDLTPLNSIGQIHAQRLQRDRDGSLWIGTAGQGLVHLHQERTDTFGPADGLSGNSVLSLFEDREGNIWVATFEGLDRFRDLAVPTLSIRQGLPGRAAVVAARDGSLWFGSNDGLNRWNNGRMTVYRAPNGRGAGRAPSFASQPAVHEVIDNGLPDNLIESLFEDDRDRIWVSTPHGIAYLENDRFIRIGSVPTTMVHNIAEEGSGSIWINDQPLGLFHLSDGQVVEQVSWASLGRQDIVAALAVDPARGGLWLGFFQGGLAYFKDGGIRLSYGAAEGLGGGRVNDIRIDREGTLWAATEGGLSRLKDGRIATLAGRNGLPCDAVHWMMEDDARSVWLNLPCGLARLGRSELDEWAAGRSQTVVPVVFDSSDGVKSLPTASGYTPRVAKSLDGKLWFTSLSGVNVVDPGHVPFNKVPAPVHIEQITADRKKYWDNLSGDGPSNPRLPPLVRDLTIDYTALSLAAPENVKFRYKLEGHDTEWQDAGTRRQAFYNDLKPRKYRFRVIACNNSGVWNEAGASFDFSVAPAYYQTTWFLVASIAAALALLAAVYRLRLGYVKQQFNLRLEERVNERTRIARDLHDTLLQSFQGVLMKFGAVALRIKDPPEAQEQLENIVVEARQAIIEGRDAVQGLRSSTVVTNDLARALTTLGEELTAGFAAEQAGPCPEFLVRVEGTTRDLPPLVRDDVHRIGSEAVRNAFRHAQASRIEVTIHYERRQFRLRVCDNGKGIDQSVAGEGGRPGHFGLPGMQERAKLAGGKLALRSGRDSGTEVELTIPAALAYAEPPVATRPESLGKGT